MNGVKSGFVTLVKNEWLHVASSHCSLHRYTPASNTSPLHFMEVMNVAVKVIDFICSRAKISGSSDFWPRKWERIIWDFCLIPKTVGWQEANASLDCMNLKMRLKSFFEKTKTTFKSNFTMKSWFGMLGYLANAFSYLNDMNLSL